MYNFIMNQGTSTTFVSPWQRRTWCDRQTWRWAPRKTSLVSPTPWTGRPAPVNFDPPNFYPAKFYPMNYFPRSANFGPLSRHRAASRAPVPPRKRWHRCATRGSRWSSRGSTGPMAPPGRCAARRCSWRGRRAASQRRAANWATSCDRKVCGENGAFLAHRSSPRRYSWQTTRRTSTQYLNRLEATLTQSVLSRGKIMIRIKLASTNFNKILRTIYQIILLIIIIS